MNVTDETTMLEMLMFYRRSQAQVPTLELYVEFEQLAISDKADESLLNEGYDTDWEVNSSDNEEEFLTDNNMLGGNNEGNEANDTEVHVSINTTVSQHSFDVPSFMCALDFNAMHALEFPEFAKPSIPFLQDSEFAVGMEFSS
ncbi:uncharacterized protein DS421_11g340310 [Arachis hypogaea]|nr:uncharacterized protein DS421_11g340310 [Arachis hypogaea]